MTIRYTVYRHRLRNHRTGYSARTQAIGTIDTPELAKRVAALHTTVALSDVFSVIEDYEYKIADLVRDGFNVRTGLVCYGTTVEGDFTDESDSFDPLRHRLKPRVTPGRRLRRALRDAPVEKMHATETRPRPLTLVDMASGQKNGILTVGGQAQLIGRNLHYDPADPRQGIFFVAGDKTETRVDQLGLNTPALQVFPIPGLAAGTYQVVVRNTSRDCQVLRSGTLDEVLTVPEAAS